MKDGPVPDVVKLKDEANVLFNKGKYGAAIEKYTEAITLDPTMTVLYVNRAMGYLRKELWQQVVADSTKALELQPNHMKALYLAGVGRLSMDEYEGASGYLSKALDAARATQDSIKDDIWRMLARAKFHAWQAASSQRAALLSALRAAADAARPWSCSCAEDGGGPCTCSSEPIGGGPSRAVTRGDWEFLFESAMQRDRPTEVPSAYTCPLTLETYREPAITKYGQSYEQHVLLEHLRKHPWDPITRQPMTEADVVPNVSLREAVRTYLDEHPWAWEELMAA